MVSFMSRGGEFMWVILATSLVALAILLERAYFLWFRNRLNADQFLNRVIGHVEEKKFSRAIEACNAWAGNPLAEVIKAGLVKANDADRDIQRAMEAATAKVVPEISKRISYLSMLANVATLLGLLGTIQGLIQAFSGIAQADAAAKQDILSRGIAVAMFTTFFGLVVAIPLIVSHAVLTSRQNQLFDQIESKGADLFNYLSARNRRLTKKT